MSMGQSIGGWGWGWLGQDSGGLSGIVWLLDDEFTDTRAAGAVNGTAATPGPGTRTATDTGSNLSIGSGIATFVGSGYGDPGLWYGNVAAGNGRTLIARFAHVYSGGQNVMVGLDSDQATTIAYSHFSRGTGGWRMYYNGDLGLPNFAYVSGTYYKTALVTGSAFFYEFVHDGSVWELVWLRSGNLSGQTLYTGATAPSGTLQLDYVRIPDELWLPTPLAYDTFTRSNGALGNSETTGPDSQTVTARTWNNRVGTTQIVSSKASASALVGGLAIATVDTSTTDTIIQATLARSGNEVGIVLRYADADNYIRAIHDGTNCKLIKRVGGVESDVISAAVAIGAGNILVIPDGTSFSLYLNNAQVGSTSTINDAGLQTGTEQGLFSTNTGNTQDDFWVMPRGSGSEYSDLDTYSA